MKTIKKLLLLSLLLAMLIGCSSQKPSKDPMPGNDPSPQTTKKVVIATDTDLASMDYHIATDGTSFIAITLVQAGLMELDENNQAVLDLAKDWSVSEDKTVYTFKLVDANWSNGEPITAHDFVYGWQRLIAQETASEYAFILETAGIKNAGAVQKGELPLSELGVKALDDKTLEVTLDKPVDFFLSLLAFPPFFPLNQKFYEAQGNQYALAPENMLFSGPYVMTNWISGNSYAFAPNPAYHKAGAAKVDEIEFKFVQDTQSAMLEYQLGNLDVVRLSGEMVEAHKDDAGFNNRLQGYLWYLSLNQNVTAIQNKDLRMAIYYGINREAIAENVLKDGSIVAGGIVPVALASSPSSGVDYREDQGQLTSFDPAKAKEHYEKAKAALGQDITLELLFEDSEASKAVAEYIQFNLESNLEGIKVNLNSKPKKTRLELMRAGTYEIGLTRWGPDYADPQSYLELFLTGGEMNHGRYANSVYDELVNEAVRGETAKDSLKRWEFLKQAEKMLLDDAAIVPVYQNGGAIMIQPSVSGIEFHLAGVDNYRKLEKK